MGGKVWSKEEEECFWTYIIPRSAKRLGVDRANPPKTWAVLTREMQERMGNQARRNYTELGLCKFQPLLECRNWLPFPTSL